MLEKEAKLTKLLKSKGQFISILAHDLRNPFSSILGFCDLLYNQYDDFEDEQKRNFILHIRQSAESTYNLLNSLLEWEKLQLSEVTINYQEFRVSELLDEVMATTEFIAVQKDINLNYQLERDFILETDIQMLATVLRNLLINAIKFSPKGNEVILNVSQDYSEGWAYFKVIDYGVGISPEALSKLFELNKKQSTLGTDNEKGTGLGLLIVNELITKLNAEIQVETTVGKGSVFTVKIPLRKSLA